jgi:hypothetical protein
LAVLVSATVTSVFPLSGGVPDIPFPQAAVKLTAKIASKESATE